MKKIIATIIFLLLFFSINQKISLAIINNNKFDINLETLNYELPENTKSCIPSKRETCNNSGCKEMKPLTFMLYDEQNKFIYRCNKVSCDKIKIYSSKNGNYEYILPKYKMGYDVKISIINNEYIETILFGLNEHKSYGICTDKN